MSLKYNYLKWDLPHGRVHRCLIINLQATQTPWGLLSNEETTNICKRYCAPAIEKFLRLKKRDRLRLQEERAERNKARQKRRNKRHRRNEKAKKLQAAVAEAQAKAEEEYDL